jgi:hypothetical protein
VFSTEFLARAKANLFQRLTQYSLIHLGVSDFGSKGVGTILRTAMSLETCVLASWESLLRHIWNMILLALFIYLIVPDDCCVCAQGKPESNGIGQEQQDCGKPTIWPNSFYVKSII